MANHFVSRVPWGLEPSLKDKTKEVGIDFDKFIEGLKNNLNDQEIAAELETSETMIANLREHFERFGVHSIVGRD